MSAATSHTNSSISLQFSRFPSISVFFIFFNFLIFLEVLVNCKEFSIARRIGKSLSIKYGIHIPYSAKHSNSSRNSVLFT